MKSGNISLKIEEDSLMSLKTNADALLRTAAESGDVPGVVAVATDRNETIYEGGSARVLWVSRPR